MTKIAKLPDGLKEVDSGQYIWFIKGYGRGYIYAGDEEGLKKAVAKVKAVPRNLGGKSVKYRKIY